MIEWGLTPEQFGEVDLAIIMRIIAQRQARNEGENKANKKDN